MFTINYSEAFMVAWTNITHTMCCTDMNPPSIIIDRDIPDTADTMITEAPAYLDLQAAVCTLNGTTNIIPFCSCIRIQHPNVLCTLDTMCQKCEPDVVWLHVIHLMAHECAHYIYAMKMYHKFRKCFQNGDTEGQKKAEEKLHSRYFNPNIFERTKSEILAETAALTTMFEYGIRRNGEPEIPLIRSRIDMERRSKDHTYAMMSRVIEYYMYNLLLKVGYSRKLAKKFIDPYELPKDTDKLTRHMYNVLDELNDQDTPPEYDLVE